MNIKHKQTSDLIHEFDIEFEGVNIKGIFRVYEKKIYKYDLQLLEDLDFESYFSVKEMCVDLLKAMGIIE